jgi:polyisoprenoid-binding protein YceI
MKRFSALLLTVAFAMMSFAIGAQNFTLDPAKSTMTVAGTSTLHDWESNVEKITSKGSLAEDGKLKSVELSVPVESIKSGKSGMDKKTYEALKSEDHPNITFSSNTPVAIVDGKASISGKLTVAGVSKDVTIPVEISKDGTSMTLKGSHLINMPGYSMKPPTAMMGTIKTGEDITVTFNLVYNIQ